jgi:hypothetical protein
MTLQVERMPVHIDCLERRGRFTEQRVGRIRLDKFVRFFGTRRRLECEVGIGELGRDVPIRKCQRVRDGCLVVGELL